ncbi:MAG: glycosyl hydrolase, partial [Flavobacteriaceae bacterium]|nr:glycosyl hydrolase [Flavobacteriaceae bacterium]
MKKKVLLFFVLALTTLVVYTISTQKSTTKNTKEKHAAFLKSHPYNKTLQLTKKERKANGMPPNKYFEQEYLLEMNPNTGKTYPENIFKIQKQLESQRKLQRVPGDGSDNMWVERGPNNIGGRTRVVLFDPNDATHKRVFAGGVSGGLWVNNDITRATTSWTRVGIDENLSISCITVDPNNSQIMYVGTGESYTGDDGIGNGVWKSTDGGSSWTNVYSDDFNADIDFRVYYINEIKAWNNPNTSKTEVFIGIAGGYYGESGDFVGTKTTGLYKTINDGVSWNKVTLPLIPGRESFTYSSQYEPNDIEIGADNTIWIGSERNIYGYGGGTILKSTDGTTFTVAHTITNGRRTELAVSATNKDKVYVLCHISGSPEMLVTSNSFGATTSITTPSDTDTGIPFNDFTRGQAWYDLVVEVDPTDDAIVYVGGIDLFRSIDNGTTWKQISKWSDNNNLALLTVPFVHADQQGWAFHPTDGNKAIIGNDGGVYYANSLSAAET